MGHTTDVLDNSIGLSAKSLKYLEETHKWANFLSILGFIGIGLIVIFGLITGVVGLMSPLGGVGGIITLIYFVIGGFYCIPVYYLFKFASDMRYGIDNRENYSIESAFESLKSHYKFIGIFTIIILSLYLLVFLGSLAFMM